MTRRKLRRAETDVELCRHENERLRARHLLDVAEIRRLRRLVCRLDRELARALARRPAKEGR